MTPERRQYVERIYQAALDRDPTARSTFLNDVCAGDAELRAEVESLLSAHPPDNRFQEPGELDVSDRAVAGRGPRATAGEHLGPYELIALIGAGGMGEVWRALDPGLRRHVAIKILPPQYSQDPDRLRRFEHEAQAAGMLNHPNVLSVYAIGRQGDAPYLVTELLDGVTLRQRLANGALPESKALDYADQLVQGLAAAHEKGIVHRDLKPENVFITRDERVKILDFGLAKLAPSGPDHDAQTMTATGVVVGTPAYMSPEQVRGQPADHRADIFAVGALLYEMLVGQRPFPGDTGVETMTAILKQDPPAIPGVSPEIDQIVRHCLEKEPAGRYQSARDLAFQLRVARHPSTPTPAPVSITQRRNVAAALVGLIFVAAAAAVLTWWLTRPTPPTPAPTFRQLTFDSGLTTDPAFAPDGQLVAYASDRSGAGNLDIWRQQLATGEAVQLTFDPADESEPAFSPDGSRLAFRSERDGGGVYVVSAFGGEPRLIARQGRRPRFSPDGSEIAFWVPVGPPYIGKVFVVSAIGGSPPIPMAPKFFSAMYPVWSGDGRNLLLLGISAGQDAWGDVFDWWVVPRDGSPAIKTGASDVFKRQRITETTAALPWFRPRPDAWVGDDVFFSGSSSEGTHLWRVSVPASTGLTEGAAEKLTSGSAVESKPSIISRHRIAFASLKQDLNIWSLSVAANVGRISGEAQQVTGSAFDANTSLSADGRKLVFISRRSGNPDVWMKDLVSGRETALTATSVHKEQAEITADGTRVAYLVNENSQLAIYEVATSGGVPQKICDDCGRPWDWSPDGSKLLYAIPEGRQPVMALGLLNATTREKTVYLEHPDYTLARARFSPDGRWVSFGAFSPTGVNRVIITPFPGNGAPTEDQWITIAEETSAAIDKPRWAPDGNLLYYVSEADGFRCIRARRLDPDTKRPSGPPFDVYHSHSARRSLMNAWFMWLDISVSQDQLFFNLAETTGNIWMAEWKSGS